MKKLTCIDLFCGCGGISEGFRLAGCKIVGGIDFNQAAIDTFARNFPGAKTFCGDICKMSAASTGFKDIDIMVGGPPCQGFSGLNRWEKNKDDDPRNKLFLQYLRFVHDIKPKAIVIENVKQILTSKGGYVPQHIEKFLGELGYNVHYQVLNAADFGVPQKRERAIFVAIRKDIGDFSFETLEAFKKPKVSVEEALSDISVIEDSAKKTAQGVVYKLGPAMSDYQRLMRDGSSDLYNHLIYYPTEYVQHLMTYVSEGGNWRDVPEELFKSHRDNRHSNYLRRLRSDSQSVTIDTGHNVYFHPKFNRVPTIRESARLQSFPDGFVFTGKKGEQFRQVGNAVPPLLAMAIAKAVKKVINK